MKEKRNSKKYILYVGLFIPLIFIFLEASLSALNKIRGIGLSSEYHFRYDQLNGWRGLQKVNKKNPQYFLLNKHTHFETPFKVDAFSKNKTKGILITGNSFAAGYFPGAGEKNKNTFFGRLETELRNENLNIDVVNIAFAGYNLWQEHVEIARYLNSSPLHNDLPNISLVISTGGIQDFLNFEELLFSKPNESRKEYLNANGIMQNLQTINYVRNLSLSQEGRPLYGLKAFVRSLINYWKLRSHTNYYFSKLTANFKNILQRSEEVGEIESIKGRDFTKIKNELSLEELINQKYNITLEKYLNLREYIINSAVRNIKATKGLLGDITYIYLYTPTMFNTAIDNSQARNFTYRKINLANFQKLEEDFRNEFLKRISAVPGVIVMDYSGSADSNSWFLDYTHLNAQGEENFSKLIYPEILKIVKNLENDL